MPLIAAQAADVAGSTTGFSVDDLYELVDESKITLNDAILADGYVLIG